MAVSRDTDLQKTEYSERNDSGSPSSYGDMLRDPYEDTIYYRDIEQIADLDVYHFGSVERKKGEDDFSDLDSPALDPEDLDDLEQRIISAGFEAIGEDMPDDGYRGSMQTDDFGSGTDEHGAIEESETVPDEGTQVIGAEHEEKASPEGMADISKLILDVSMCEEMNFVMQLGGVLLVRDIMLKNEGDSEIRDIKVTISSDDEIIFPCTESAPTLYEGEEWHIVQPDVRVNTSYLAFLSERTECTIDFELTGKDRYSNLVSKSVRKTVVVMAYDQWKGNDFHTDLIPAFIMPNQPFISELVTDAAGILGKETGTSILDAYLSDDKNRIRQMAQAAYEAVTRRRISEIPYASNEEDILRRIRLAEKIRKHNRASAYDITLVYLSCLEAMGLNPVMYLRREDAYAGVWLKDRTFDESVMSDEIEAVQRVDSGEILLIDCRTMLLGLECPFDESVQRAVNSVFIPDGFVAMLDISRARREGVKSLPLRIHADSVSSPDARKRRKDKKRKKAQSGSSKMKENRIPDGNTAEENKPESRALANAFRNSETWKRRLYDPDSPNQLTDMKLDGMIIPLLSAFVNDYVDMLSDVMYFGLVSRPEEYIKPEELTPENYNQVEEIRDILRTDFRRKKVHTVFNREETAQHVREIIFEANKGLENHGNMILYLAAGILRWTEISSGAVRYAPLVLLPVEVKQGNNGGRPFRLSETQPQFNYALLEKMENEYFLHVEGLFPLPRDYHGVDVKKVCELFRNAIGGREGWAVMEEAFLGIFDLPGYFQSRTLGSSEVLKEHHILRGLTEGMRRTDIDKAAVRAEHVYLPFRADSYQEYAVKAAMQDTSFVLSGAPGSGKTQTIANIIANAISRGKSVLFACEKTQAYRDVLQRIESAGLSPFCLYEQQGSIRTRDLLAHLKRAMQAANLYSGTAYEEKEYEVTEIGKALDGYSETMNSRHVCGYSLRELLDIYEEYREYPEFPMYGIDADSVTSVILKQRRELVGRLVDSGKSIGHPKESPLSCVKRTFYTEELRGEAERVAAEGYETLGKFRDVLESFVNLLELNLPVTQSDIEQMITIAEFVSELRDVPSFLLLKNDAGPTLTQLREYISGADAFAGKDIAMGGKWDQEFLHADMDEYLTGYNTAKSKLFFRDRAVKEFKEEMAKHAGFDFDEKEIPELLNEVKLYQEESRLQAQRWEDLSEESRSLLKEYSSYDAADELTRRVEAYRQLCDQLPTLMRYAYNVDIRKSATESADALPELYEKVKKYWNNLVRLLDIEEEGYTQDPSGTMDGVCKALLDNKDMLQNQIQYNDLALRTRSNGLGFLVDRYLEGASHEEIMGIFSRGIYSSLIRSILDRNPAAGQFEAQAFNDLIAHFRQIDNELTRLAVLKVQEKLATSRPRPQESPKIAVELMGLRRAISTFGRGTTARNIFDQMPDVLVRLCPCVMMSPAACAEYMTDKWPMFDLVIIDEASEVATERAAGVIARGREVILSGDICQNPVSDSILDMCLAAGLPEIRLGIHYRSRDERLFSFSNRQFYNDAYLTFPSPVEEVECIEYVDVPDGEYDSESHVNEAEARTVVREILRLYSENKDKKCSVGVVAFGYHQSLRIEELLEEEYARDSLFAEWVKSSEEKLIVTDVANAQGYERENVFLSVTMTGDAGSHELAHILGENGWRYLNTAVTRAREHITVVSSITAEEIREKTLRSRGAATLADYLDYASGNRSEIADPVSIRRQKKAGVLNAIRKTLDEAGYMTHAMLGESDFRVDIAVSMVENRDRYILGILLDSENYSGIESPRDRDILMSSELLKRGWPVINVWCMEWWTNREAVKKRLLDAADYIKSRING